MAFLSELLQSKQLHALVQVHNRIVAKGKDDKFYPLLSNAMQVTLEVLQTLAGVIPVSKEYEELLSVLHKPHFQVSLLICVLIFLQLPIYLLIDFTCDESSGWICSE